VQKSHFWKVKEPLSQRESGTFVFSLCGEYFSFTFVNCFTELKNRPNVRKSHVTYAMETGAYSLKKSSQMQKSHCLVAFNSGNIVNFAVL